MQINITARHLKLTPAIAEYVQKKLDKARRYFDPLISAQVILSVEKTRHIAEVVLHASGRTFTAKEESADLYAAVDLASDKIDEQLRRYKERRRLHRPSRKTQRLEAMAADAAALPPEPESDHRITGVRSLRLFPMSLNEAISAMEQSDSAHWIFLDRESRRVTVVYRKPDRSYSVIEAIV